MTKTHVCIHTDMCVRMPLKDTCTHSCMRAYTHMHDGICSCMAHAHLSLSNAYGSKRITDISIYLYIY